MLGAAVLLSSVHGQPCSAAPGNEAKRSARVQVNAHWQGDPALFGKTLVAIRYDGLHRTVRKVIDRELLIRVGTALSEARLVETVQRLRNLGIFRQVVAFVQPGPNDDSVALQLHFDEKWTLLPVFSWGRGGDRLFLTAGAQDTNLAGRFLQIYPYYTYFAGTHSGSLRLDDPRLFDKRLHLAVLAELGNRNRYIYNDQGALDRLYSRHRTRAWATFWDRRNPLNVPSASLQLLDDTYDEALLEGNEKALNKASGVSLPGPQRFVTLDVGYRIGRLDADDYVISGGYVTASLGGGLPLREGNEAFMRGVLGSKVAWALPGRGNLVLRGELGFSTSREREFQRLVGGLYYMRGFFEGRFAGHLSWVANTEYRVPSLHSRLAVIQHVFFVDAGDARGSWSELARRPPVSVGTGGRLLLPLIANFVARLDIAWFFEPNRAFRPAEDWRVSFGSQQHF